MRELSEADLEPHARKLGMEHVLDQSRVGGGNIYTGASESYTLSKKLNPNGLLVIEHELARMGGSKVPYNSRTSRTRLAVFGIYHHLHNIFHLVKGFPPEPFASEVWIRLADGDVRGSQQC